MKNKKVDEFKSLSKNLLGYYSRTTKDNEYKMNRLNGYFGVLCALGLIICLILNWLDVFILDKTKLTIAVAVLVPLLLIPLFICCVFKVEKGWVKYFILILDCVIIAASYTFLTMHAVLFFVIPILFSCLYFNRRISLIVSIANLFGMFVSHIIAVPLAVTPDDPINVSLSASLVYGFIPRCLVYLVLCAIFALLTYTTAKMVAQGYEYADNNEQLLSRLRKTHYEIVKNLATIAENKSSDTGEHIGRVFEYMKILAKYEKYSDDEIYNISLAAMLHDVGKLGVDEKILSKPARLTPEEFEEVKKHARYGKELLKNSNNDVLIMAAIIAEQHHERWDGKGYHGLKGEEIDIRSRMMSVVDVFDALTSKRCYKEAWSLDDAYNEIVSNKGTQFDPEVVQIFENHFDEFTAVYRRYNLQ